MPVTMHIMYKQPTDPEHFLQHYADVHAGLAGAIPGVTRFEHGPTLPNPDGTAGEWFYIATMQFDSMESMGAAMGSPEAAAAIGDVPNYASGGMSTAIVTH